MSDINLIGTNKKGNITVTLSDEDSRILFERCGEAGISVSELMENFIRDLTYSNRSNGSDEEDLINLWFSRCGFGRYKERSLLQVLLSYEENYSVGYFLDVLENVKRAREELNTYLNAPVVHDEDELEALKGDVEFWEEELKSYESDFCTEIPEADMEKEIQKVKEWWAQREQFMEESKEQENELYQSKKGLLR